MSSNRMFPQYSKDKSEKNSLNTNPDKIKIGGSLMELSAQGVTTTVEAGPIHHEVGM